MSTPTDENAKKPEEPVEEVGDAEGEETSEDHCYNLQASNFEHDPWCPNCNHNGRDAGHPYDR